MDGRDACVAALDHGLTVGDGIFETLKVIDGTAFALTRHLARLRRSALVLGLEVPLSDDDLVAASIELIVGCRVAGAEPGRLRITITGGPGPLGSGRDHAGATVVLAAGPAPEWTPTTAVVTVPWVRNERSATAGAKTTSYAENVVALAAAHERGATEAIFTNTVGALCEGTGTNLFVVNDGRLRTPSLATGCLAGITRELLLEVVVGCGEVADLTTADLRNADEAFLTSSTRDVQPIDTVDGLPLGAAPGPVTAATITAFAAVQVASLDP